MSSLGLLAVILLTGLLLSISGWDGDADPYLDQSDLREAIAETSQPLKAYCDRKDLAGFDAEAHRIAADWLRRNQQGYYRFVWQVCVLLRNTDFKTQDRYSLADRYAMAALHNVDSVPFDVATGLLKSLQPPTDAHSMETRVALWLRVWERIESAIDPSFDPTRLPQNNSGLTPDPKEQLIAQERAAQDRAYTAYFNDQYQLRQLQPEFARVAILYFKAAHLDRPEGLSKLQAMVNRSSLRPATKRSIMESMRSQKK